MKKVISLFLSAVLLISVLQQTALANVGLTTLNTEVLCNDINLAPRVSYANYKTAYDEIGNKSLSKEAVLMTTLWETEKSTLKNDLIVMDGIEETILVPEETVMEPEETVMEPEEIVLLPEEISEDDTENEASILATIQELAVPQNFY